MPHTRWRDTSLPPTLDPENAMSSYLKIVDADGDMQYVNPDRIMWIRPGNRKSFRESGAEIRIKDGSESRSVFTEAGAATAPVIAFLGVEEH